MNAWNSPAGIATKTTKYSQIATMQEATLPPHRMLACIQDSLADLRVLKMDTPGYLRIS